MGLFDFMNTDLGGYTGVVQAPQTGMTGITYNDVANAALKYGSKLGSSGPLFAGMNTTPQQPVGGIQNLDPNKKQQSNSTGDLLKVFLGFFGM